MPQGHARSQRVLGIEPSAVEEQRRGAGALRAVLDLADDPAYGPVRVEHAEKLLAWRARHLDRTMTGMLLTENGVVDGRGRAE